MNVPKEGQRIAPATPKGEDASGAAGADEAADWAGEAKAVCCWVAGWTNRKVQHIANNIIARVARFRENLVRNVVPFT